jgi:hypothetical protein
MCLKSIKELNLLLRLRLKPKNERVENVALSQICLWFRDSKYLFTIMGMPPIRSGIY